jgi:hypothetical protein
MPFDCLPPEDPGPDPDSDKWLGRWLAEHLSLGDIVHLYVGMGRRRADGAVVLCPPRPPS